MLRHALFIARHDLRFMLRQRETLLWMFVMPPVFFYFIGTVTGGFGGAAAGGGAPLAVQAPVNGGIVVGARLTGTDGIDLRTEGMALYRNGAPAGSGTGVEVLGDPLHSVAFMANTLAPFGLKLEAGMLLMTGSITRSIPLAAADDIAVAFTRLGRLDLSLVA